MTQRTCRHSNDRGSSTPMLVILLLTMVLFVGLVADGGAIFTARREAQNSALAAARAGSNQVDTDSLFQGDPTLDSGKATAAVTSAVVASGHTLVSHSVSNVDVSVTVSKSVPMRFFTILGISNVTVTEDAKAQLLSALESQDSP